MIGATFLLLILASPALAQQSVCGLADRLDNDMKGIPEPRKSGSGYYYDFLDGTFFLQTRQAFDFGRIGRKISRNPEEAYNVNCEGGVPDSSWFTNRNGKRHLSLEEIRRGPNQSDGPEGGTFVVTRGKTAGISAGFFIKDEKGQEYIVKFDPPDNPEMATAAEVISTKLLYAIGFHVPQNTIFHFSREQLSVASKAEFTDDLGKQRQMTEQDLDHILSKAARREDGSYRVVASLLLPGKPKGGFDFAGTRKDDPNDIIPHEHRRELRGLRVFSAWLEHNDIRVGNSLDVYVGDNGRGYLRHYLIDFGSTLGSDTVFPNRQIVGRENIFDWKMAGRVLLTAGIYQPSWRSRDQKLEYPSVGIYSAKSFDPDSWKPNIPLAAFENMTKADARWAAEIVASFTDAQIGAAVDTAELTDKEAAGYLKEQIIARRDIIARKYLKQPPASHVAQK
jgi:hypothetical protein